MPEAAARTAFVGFEFDADPLDSVVAAMRDRPADAPFVYAATPNVDHAVRLDGLKGDEAAEVKAAYRAARWCLCDSRILARIGKVKGIALPVVPGSTLTAALFDTVIAAGDRIAIVGGDETTLPDLQALYPNVVFTQHIPPMGLRRDPAARAVAAAFIAEADARFTFIAVGSPQQELIAQIVTERGEATGIGLCVGASIEFLTGKVQRAPGWMQRSGLEWSHRLLSDPKRLWRRYLVEGPRIFGIAMRESRQPRRP